MTAIDTTYDLLAAIAADPIHLSDRDVLEQAIRRCAADHNGRVHASWLRSYIPAGRDIKPQLIGAIVRHRPGFLHPTGDHLPNGGGSGNARKLSPVWRYVGD